MTEIGDNFKVENVVSTKDTAIAMGSGGLEVYATPAMVALMESAAFNLLKSKGEDSVGTMINIKHLRACKINTKVWAVATVTGVNGNWVNFKIEAFDDKGEIGTGEHTRYIINCEKFMSKLG
jgi:Predicted thioesterase